MLFIIIIKKQLEIPVLQLQFPGFLSRVPTLQMGGVYAALFSIVYSGLLQLSKFQTGNLSLEMPGIAFGAVSI